MIGGGKTKSELFLALILLASLISMGSLKYSDSGVDVIIDAPKEDFVREVDVREVAEVPEDSNDSNDSKTDAGKVRDIEFEIPTGGGASKISVPEAGSNDDVPPLSILLNKVVWLDMGNRTLDGNGPYGNLVVNRIPVGGPDFNRLLEDSGYLKVRVFENVSGFCSWWDDPSEPKLPGGEDVEGQGPETVQVKRFYVGWAYSNTYHYPDCRWAKNIPTGSQVWFSSPEEAKAEGYVPCSTCNPP